MQRSDIEQVGAVQEKDASRNPGGYWWDNLFAEPDDVARLEPYQQFFAIHCLCLVIHHHFIQLESTRLSDWVIISLAILALLPAFFKRPTLAAVASVLVHATSAVDKFPFTANHAGWAFVFGTSLLLWTGSANPARSIALIRALVVILVGWTGIQKLVYGTYFEAEFLLVFANIKPSFQPLLALFMSPDERSMFFRADYDTPGMVQYSTDNIALILVSNLTWVLEIALPIGLCFRRTRRLMAVVLIGFLGFIQLGARELVFATLALGTLSLYLPIKPMGATLKITQCVLVLLVLVTLMGLISESSWA